MTVFFILQDSYTTTCHYYVIYTRQDCHIQPGELTGVSATSRRGEGKPHYSPTIPHCYRAPESAKKSSQWASVTLLPESVSTTCRAKQRFSTSCNGDSLWHYSRVTLTHCMSQSDALSFLGVSTNISSFKKNTPHPGRSVPCNTRTATISSKFLNPTEVYPVQLLKKLLAFHLSGLIPTRIKSVHLVVTCRTGTGSQHCRHRITEFTC